MKIIRIALLTVLGLQGLAGAAVVSVTLGSGSYNLRDNTGALLTSGGAGNFDGALVFVGFYSDWMTNGTFGASDATFVKLSGVGNTFGTANTTVGDQVSNGAGPGQFFINGLTINDTVNPAGLPAANTPLVVRVLDAQTEGSANYKMEFSNPTFWKWISPTVPAPSINIDLDDANLRLMDPTGRTSTPISGGGDLNANVQVVPEPSTLALQGVVLMWGGFVRQRGRRRK